MRWANVFAQDEIALQEYLRLTLGAKLENNYYTGTEPLPSARLAWKLEPQRLLWGAVSRALRAPSRIDRDFFVGPPLQLNGGAVLVAAGGKVLRIRLLEQPPPEA